jgi:hypothetical protein
VYALVERGCRYIYVLDDGADPKPCFSDMGELIRRCRIDFGAEINLVEGITNFRWDSTSGLGKDHFVIGTIEYSKEHLRSLGWGDKASDNVGLILWIKPTITEHNSVDLRQYRMENEDFPQQTTLDQWYDEAQFESYRKLGQQSVERWMDANKVTVVAEHPASLFPSSPPPAIAGVLPVSR